jgi:hypothetical protein
MCDLSVLSDCDAAFIKIPSDLILDPNSDPIP